MTIFEKIVKKEIPAYRVYEDDDILAFLDISQTTLGHTLVIPKKAYTNIYDIPNDLYVHLMSVVKKLSHGINKAFKPLGLNIINNNGSAAGQTVFHYHVHIIPRYKNDNLVITYSDNSSKLKANDYKKRASAIRTAL